MTAIERDRYSHASENAANWYHAIVTMVEALQAIEPHREDDREDAERAIHESVLSVEVRGGWYPPDRDDCAEPCEYRICLATGGPALQIRGELGVHCEPQTARLEMQDWGLPWKSVVQGIDDKILLAFAAQFYFGFL